MGTKNHDAYTHRGFYTVLFKTRAVFGLLTKVYS
jgi:hypothetical protein